MDKKVGSMDTRLEEALKVKDGHTDVITGTCTQGWKSLGIDTSLGEQNITDQLQLQRYVMC